MNGIIIPGKMGEFSEIFGKELVPILAKNGPKLIASFHTYTGNMNFAFNLLAYDDLAALEKIGQINRNDPAYQKVNAKLATFLTSQTKTLLEPNPWSPMK
jgi:hypothetical protein